MSKLPLVSILIPVYGVEQYIVRCLKSVVSQTYKNIELIIVDDCSPDNSISLAESFMCLLDVNYIILRHSKNRGLAAARNSGLLEAKGEFIYFLDSDDYLPTNSINEYVKSMLNNNSDIVVSDLYIKKDEIVLYNKINISLDVENYLNMSLLRKSSFNICGKLFRKDLFIDLHFVEGINMGEDYLMFNKVISYAQKISYVNLPLYIYDKSNESSYTNCIDKRLIEQLVNAQINLNKFYENNLVLNILLPYSNAQIIVHMLKMSFKNKEAYDFVFAMYKEFIFDTNKLNSIDSFIFKLYKLKMKGLLRAALTLGDKVIKIFR